MVFKDINPKFVILSKGIREEIAKFADLKKLGSAIKVKLSLDKKYQLIFYEDCLRCI